MVNHLIYLLQIGYEKKLNIDNKFFLSFCHVHRFVSAELLYVQKYPGRQSAVIYRRPSPYVQSDLQQWSITYGSYTYLFHKTNKIT